MGAKVALIDMDGTIADYDLAMKQALERLRSPGEPEYTSFGGEGAPWLEARRKLVSQIPGFWRNLPRYRPGFDVIDELKAHGFDLMVLTKGPTSKPAAWGEKVEWCRAQLPPNTPVTITEDKSLVYGKILVDDYPDYFEPWLRHRPRGIVICPAHPWNEGADKKDPAHVFRYDATSQWSQDALCRVIIAVADREDGDMLDLPKIINWSN